MGNFSRDTFDPSKGYTGVRLQQGVPIVDADWNELQDVIRQELYYHFANQYGIWNDGVLPVYGDELRVFTSDSPNSFYTNNFYTSSGVALVDGRLAYRGGGYYISQRWYDPVVAEAEGVDVIPPLTTPSSARTDAVYLDIWDREVGSDQDPDIINPVIGIETSVRSKREVAVRVNEGSSSHPWPIPKGHRYYVLARLNRPAGTAIITNDQIIDARRVFYDRPGTHYVGLSPTLFPYGTGTAFTNYLGQAQKPSASASAMGLVPISLPHGVRLSSVRIRGRTTGAASITTTVYRSPQDSGYEESLVSQSSSGDPFTRSLYLPYDNTSIIDNDAYNYFLYLYASGANATAEVTGIRLYYYI